MAKKEVLELEVKSNIKSVTKDTDTLGESVGKASNEATELGKGLETAGKKGKKGFQGIGTAVRGIGVALKAAGIGIIIGLLAKLMEVFSSNQKVVDFFSTTMTALGIAFNDLFSYLDTNYELIKGYLKGLFTDPLGELAKLGMGIEKFFIEKMKGLVMVLEGLKIITNNITNPKKYAEGLAKIVAGTTIAGKEIAELYDDIILKVDEYTSGVLDQAQAITKSSNASQLAAAQIQGLIEKYDRQAELQRQIRDDERLTFAERKAANDKIGKILITQEKEMLALAATRVRSAKLERDANKTKIELQVAYQEALNDSAAVSAQVAGFASEQINNEAALEKELADSKREIAEESLQGIDRELLELKNAYKLKEEMARKANVSDLELTYQYGREKRAIIAAYAAEEVAADKLVNDTLMSQKLKFVAASGKAIGALGSLMKEGSNEAKALALTEVAINTGVGFMNALRIAQQGGIGTGTAAPFTAPIFYASQIAAVLSAAAQAKSILGAGGGASSSSLPSSSIATPSQEMMSGSFELTGGQEVEPVQAYVVSDQITDNQNALELIRRRATI